ncbi:MAG: tetratricopeptide repeat protein [Saprospiraceae bacterium]|nr:tetratricopeptide repeat protein [Saprospiraceae bacterium]
MAKKPKPGKVQQRPQFRPQEKKSAATAPKQAGYEQSGWLTFALVAMGITALCYFSSLSNGLVNWDDDPNITENPNLLRIKEDGLRAAIPNIFDIDKGAVIGNYNPLPVLTFAIEKAMAGDFNTTLIHFTNLLLHLLTVFFAVKLLARMGIGNWGVFIGGLLFGIHPMRVESVAWATERKDVLFAVFFFAALVYYVKWLKQEERGENRTGTYIVMIALALLSCLSKVQAVTLPLSMLVLDYWFRRPMPVKSLLLWGVSMLPVVGLAYLLSKSMGAQSLGAGYKALAAVLSVGIVAVNYAFRKSLPGMWEKNAFWIFSIIFGVINLYTLAQQGSTTDDVTEFGLGKRLFIGAYSFCVYLYKLVLPYPMSPLYPYPKPLPLEIYAAIVPFLLAWGAVWWAWRNDRRVWVFGTLFFFFNVMFLLQVLGAGQGFKADRFTYVPYFGFFVVAAWYFEHYYNKTQTRGAVQAIAAVFLLAFAVMTFKQIGVWKNGETLWTHVIKYEGKSNSLPYWNRGQYNRSKGDFDKALNDYSQAVTIDPNNPELYNSRGKTYFDMAMSGKFEAQSKDLAQKALKDYTTALGLPNIKPKSKAEILINRGAAYGSQRMFQQSIDDITEGLKIDPKNENGYFNRSIAYYTIGQVDNALSDYNEYLKFEPNNANVWYESGMILRAKGQSQEAIERLSRAIKLDPGLGIAYVERARGYIQMGNRDAARDDYQHAQQLGMQLTEADLKVMNGQ